MIKTENGAIARTAVASPKATPARITRGSINAWKISANQAFNKFKRREVRNNLKTLMTDFPGLYLCFQTLSRNVDIDVLLIKRPKEASEKSIPISSRIRFARRNNLNALVT